MVPGKKEFRYFLNILRALSNYRKGLIEVSHNPLIFWIEPTNTCNLKCPMCPTTYSEGGEGLMEISLFEKVLDQSADYLLDGFLLQGGEPLIHPELPRMIEMMNDRDVYPMIYTNGTLLTERLSKKILDRKVMLVSFSFDGYDRETYESIRRGADFDETLYRIKAFLQMKKEKGLKYPYVIIESLVNAGCDDRFTREKRNVFMKRFKGLPVNEFSTKMAVGFGQDVELYSESSFQPPSLPYSPAEHPNYRPCSRLWTTMSILWDGTVVPCCVDLYGEMKLGEIPGMTVDEIWNGPAMKALREKQLNGELDGVNPCVRCGLQLERTVFGIPMSFFGPPSLLRRILGIRAYRRLFKTVRALTGFRGYNTFR